MDIRGFQLTAVPDDFLDDPYPYYATLREHDPLHELEGVPLRDRRVRFRGFRSLPARVL